MIFGGRGASLGSLGSQFGALEPAPSAAMPGVVCVTGTRRPTIALSGHVRRQVAVTGTHRPEVRVTGNRSDC